MKSKYVDDTIPKRLIDAFTNEGVIAFVGAGVSISEGLPDWRGLIEMILSEVSGEFEKKELHSVRKHLAGGDFLVVADYLKRKLGRTRYKDFMEKNFTQRKIGALHQMIVSLPFAGIITTNYDEILSYSDKDQKFGHPFSWNDEDVLRKTKRPFLLHAHGMASSADTTILSASDYNDLSLNYTNIKFWETLKLIFLNRRVLFIGYSLNDPDLNLLLSKIQYLLPGNTNEHFAFIVSKDIDVLNFYRLKEILGITPITALSEDIGRQTFNWLNELKAKLFPVTSIKVISSTTAGKAESANAEFLKLKAEFIDTYLNTLRFSSSLRGINIKDAVPKIKFSRMLNLLSINDLDNLSDIELRSLLSFLSKNHISNSLAIRMLSYLSPE